MRRALVFLLLPGCAAVPHEQSEWERQNQQRPATEEALALPPYPTEASLVEFPVIDAGGFRFFVDAATLRAGEDGVVRYVLVARSAEGARNVSYEGLRCSSAEHRVYALGRPDGSWVPSRGAWRPLVGGAQRWHSTLYREYFCPQNEPLRSAAEGRRALEQGGHPSAKAAAQEYGR